MWLEMSRDEEHGGTGWGFTECLWSPTHKDPKGKWSHWETVREVRRGNVVLHLRGKGRKAHFVGFSTATSDGYETYARPPILKEWAYAKSFYRVDLSDFVRFEDPINLYAVFAQQDAPLREYFATNSSRARTARERLFFVIQSNRVQCLNGAYLSDFSTALGNIIFGSAFWSLQEPGDKYTAVSAKTGQQVRQMKVRVGQDEFSENVRSNYSYRCCFPSCEIAEGSLLIGAHIARWAENEDTRGLTANGLCLCLFHDKAFELGMYTLTADQRIWINPSWIAKSSWAKSALAPYHGKPICKGVIAPSQDALKEHWSRIGFSPSAA